MRLFLAIRVPDPAAAALERLQEALPLGRPVDLEILADGSMLVSDDDAGRIYRISYEP